MGVQGAPHHRRPARRRGPGRARDRRDGPGGLRRPAVREAGRAPLPGLHGQAHPAAVPVPGRALRRGRGGRLEGRRQRGRAAQAAGGPAGLRPAEGADLPRAAGQAARGHTGRLAGGRRRLRRVRVPPVRRRHHRAGLAGQGARSQAGGEGRGQGGPEVGAWVTLVAHPGGGARTAVPSMEHDRGIEPRPGVGPRIRRSARPRRTPAGYRARSARAPRAARTRAAPRRPAARPVPGRLAGGPGHRGRLPGPGHPDPGLARPLTARGRHPLRALPAGQRRLPAGRRVRHAPGDLAAGAGVRQRRAVDPARAALLPRAHAVDPAARAVDRHRLADPRHHAHHGRRLRPPDARPRLADLPGRPHLRRRDRADRLALPVGRGADPRRRHLAGGGRRHRDRHRLPHPPPGTAGAADRVKTGRAPHAGPVHSLCTTGARRAARRRRRSPPPPGTARTGIPKGTPSPVLFDLFTGRTRAPWLRPERLGR
ncbi:hypothetical protein SGPA1_50095 [Streptomyces misionensis JCM 4497]